MPGENSNREDRSVRWATAAATLAAITWTAAIYVGITSHPEQGTVPLAVYLAIGAAVATIFALGFWLTERIITELRALLALGHLILAELRSEHDEADRALRSLLNNDDSNPRIPRINI
jgi:hypothetical protein